MLNPHLGAMTPRRTNDEKMEKYIFNYDEWLSGHAKRKTMMEKLERSLIPFEIFDAIGMRNDRQARSGEVTVFCYFHSLLCKRL